MVRPPGIQSVEAALNVTLPLLLMYSELYEGPKKLIDDEKPMGTAGVEPSSVGPSVPSVVNPVRTAESRIRVSRHSGPWHSAAVLFRGCRRPAREFSIIRARREPAANRR